MKNIFFVTTNAYKYEIAVNILKNLRLDNNSIKLKNLNISCPEIQDEKVRNVALYSAKWASEKINQPVITSDSGFFIPALNNFPGPFVKYINKWLTARDIVKLLGNSKNRQAYFIDALAYVDPHGREAVFQSKTAGRIIEHIPANSFKKNNHGWSVDSIFIPDGYEKPLSELNGKERLEVWNKERWIKLKKFLDKYEKEN